MADIVLGYGNTAVKNGLDKSIAILTDAGGAAITPTPSRAVSLDSGGRIKTGNTTDTELEYVNGATSNLQAQINTKQGIWEASQAFYVGLHGDDGNTGLSNAQAFLTFGAAITAANLLTPSETNRIAIFCQDAGDYTEDLTIPSWIGIIAIAAKINGNHVVADNSLLQSFRLVATAGTVVTKSAGTGSATVVCPRMVITNGTNGVLCTSGSITYSGNYIEVENGYGIGALTTGNIRACLTGIYISGTGIGAGIASTGNLDITCGEITGAGSGTGLYVASTGSVHANVLHLECNTAYNVAAAGATLNLVSSYLSGTKTNSGTVNLVSTNSDIGITGSIFNQKAMITPEGGIAVKMTNKTGGLSVKGEVVTIYASTDNAVAKIVVDIPTPIGVFYESGIADGSEAWIVVSGIADVYFVGNTTRGNLARGFLTADGGSYVTGQALSEAVPTTPFATDKHFYEIGHVAENRTGAGLAKVVLHFN